MTNLRISRTALALVAAAMLLAACGRPSVGGSTASATVARPVATIQPAAIADAAVRSLRTQLARVTAERDAARAQLSQALARERALEAQLAHQPPAQGAYPAHPSQTAVPAEAGGAQQIFRSVSTSPSP